jgi:hypothetical protein
MKIFDLVNHCDGTTYADIRQRFDEEGPLGKILVGVTSADYFLGRGIEVSIGRGRQFVERCMDYFCLRAMEILGEKD